MCCFYPGNVICLNAPPPTPRSPGGLAGSCARFSPAAVTVSPGYLWETTSAGSSRTLPFPTPPPPPGSCRFIGCPRHPPKLPRWDSLRRRVVRVNTVSGQEQTQRRWRPSGEAEEGESEVWQPLCGPSLRKCSHRKYLRVVMCKHGRCW